MSDPPRYGRQGSLPFATWGDRAVSRRSLLRAFGGAVVVASATAGCQGEAPVRAGDYTVARWVAERGTGYLIGHRGAGDVVPEHTLEAYEAALGWGAKALEISVVRTLDGVLVCQHDLTLDRTTDLSGTISKLPWSQVQNARLQVPRLGPRWSGERAPRLSRLEDVLAKVGSRAVLCLEAKDHEAYPAMVEMVEQQRLKESAVIKLHVSSTRFAEAKEAGYPVFGYLGSFFETTPARIKELAARLDPRTDYLVVPSNENAEWLPDKLLAAAVATKVPVWVFGVHRRSELAHHLGNGAAGAVVSSIGYLGGTTTALRADVWESGAISPGEMTHRPESNDYALAWPGEGAIGLTLADRQSFVTFGQLAPLRQPSGPYELSLEVRVDRMPTQSSTNFTVAFGHADDRYYEHRQGTQNGYHALLRMDGSLELWAHAAGSQDGVPLGKPVSGGAPVVGTWVPLRLVVTPTALIWTRLDTGASVTVADSRFRGDYVHVGRSAIDGALSVRRLRVG
ncbi:glycerophosphodiester phosphodiesterase [Terrabacter sp. Ter38]|uniref:glycerophosphodiester phosphodiesterase n=1 Tax=Terrabacter sp. Ter38 TaxID=2926030 RepID=UPI0021177CBB|nr:glycerophosphodiester phosphodiesterase [Terrabacter sp. Ter38]